MNAIELLGKSIEAGHGREFTADQLNDIGATLQAMQRDLLDQYARVEALTRFAVVAIDSIGGSLDMTAIIYSEAENYGLDVDWDEEKDIIHAKTYQVLLPEVSEEDRTDGGGDDGSVPSVSGEGGTEEELASEEDGA